MGLISNEVAPVILAPGQIFYLSDIRPGTYEFVQYNEFTKDLMEAWRPDNGRLKKIILAKCIEGSKFTVGKVVELFPGDLGIPGFAYDARPCSLHFTQEAATAAAGTFHKWWNNPAEQKSV